jgi:hypothetical protein
MADRESGLKTGRRIGMDDIGLTTGESVSSAAIAVRTSGHEPPPAIGYCP